MCSGPGKVPEETSAAYSFAAWRSTPCTSAYCLTKRGSRPVRNPAMSCHTSTWASQSTPAPIPTVGIGAGNRCDAQVLVWQDALGLRTGRLPRFVKQYADVHGVLLEGARAFAADVAAGTFPGPEHTF